MPRLSVLARGPAALDLRSEFILGPRRDARALLGDTGEERPVSSTISSRQAHERMGETPT